MLSFSLHALLRYTMDIVALPFKTRQFVAQERVWAEGSSNAPRGKWPQYVSPVRRKPLELVKEEVRSSDLQSLLKGS